MESNEAKNSIANRFSKYLTDLRNYEFRAVIQLIFFLIGIATIIGFAQRDLSFNISLIFFASLYLAALYLCISLGLSMTYKLLNFANFAHAEYFLVGAYTGIAYSMLKSTMTFFDIIIVIILSFVLSGFTAILGDILVYKPLRNLQSPPETLMISSIGWSLIIRNTVAILFGGGVVYFRWISFPILNIPSIRIGGKNVIDTANYGLRIEYIITIVVAALMVSGLFYLLLRTKTGKALRATSDNIDLAESSGIDTAKMINITWFIGGGLAGVAGVMFSLTTAVFSNTGFLYLLPAFAVVVLGGIGSLKGSIYAGVIVAFSQNISVSYLSWLEEPLQRSGLIAYQRVVPFAVLILVILLKPFGLYGEDLD